MGEFIIGCKFIGCAIASCSLIGAAIGTGLIFNSLISALASNPSARGEYFSTAILGFALTEAIGFFGLILSFIILFGF